MVSPTPVTATTTTTTLNTNTTTSFTPVKTKEEETNVIAIVVPVVLVSIVLGVLMIVGWLYIRNKPKPRLSNSTGNDNPSFRLEKKPSRKDSVPDVVACWIQRI